MAVVEPPIYACVTRRSAFLRLWLLGLIGAGITAAQPLPASLLLGARVPELAFRALAFFNTALILAVLVGLGTVAAREVGLYSVFAPQVPSGTRPRDRGLHWVQAAILVGVTVVGVQVAFDGWFWRIVPTNQVLLLRHAAELSAASPMSRLIFQALTDELMLRWGLMSGLLWVLALLLRQKSGRQRPALVWTAILGVTTLYIAGQAPSVLNVLSTDPASMLLVRSVAASAVAGIAYGWLYWKHGLESAVLAHVLAQVGLVAFEGLALF